MTLTSPELSKTLFELSGWDDSGWTWFKHGRKTWFNSIPTPEAYRLRFKDWWAAYPLDYLLEKLPVALIPHTGSWNATYDRGMGKPYVASADNPCDAVCKLIIALFEQGILPKDGDA